MRTIPKLYYNSPVFDLRRHGLPIQGCTSVLLHLASNGKPICIGGLLSLTGDELISLVGIDDQVVRLIARVLDQHNLDHLIQVSNHQPIFNDDNISECMGEPDEFLELSRAPTIEECVAVVEAEQKPVDVPKPVSIFPVMSDYHALQDMLCNSDTIHLPEGFSPERTDSAISSIVGQTPSNWDYGQEWGRNEAKNDLNTMWEMTYAS